MLAGLTSLTPLVEDSIELVKGLAADARDTCKRLLERHNRQQRDADDERQASGQECLDARVPESEQTAEADRDRAAADQHTPDAIRHVGPNVEQPVSSRVIERIQPLQRLRIPDALVIVLRLELVVSPPEPVVSVP